MWFRVFQSQAILCKCIEQFIFEGDTVSHYHPDVVAGDYEHDSIEGDANCQRRLSCPLWVLTDKDVD